MRSEDELIHNRTAILDSVRDEVGITVEALGGDHEAVLRACVAALWENAAHVEEIRYSDGGAQYVITPPEQYVATPTGDRATCGHERYGSTARCAVMICANYVNRRRGDV